MADEIEEQIEAAEESGDTEKLLSVIASCAEHGGDDSWTEVAEGSLDALYRLIKGGSDPKEDTLEKIFTALAAWQDEEAIVEVALGCIVAVSSKKTMQNEDGIDISLILSLMRDFKEESTIQEQACLSIEGLASLSDALKDRLIAIDGIKEELAVCKARITNERNKAYPGRAAAALGIKI